MTNTGRTAREAVLVVLGGAAIGAAAWAMFAVASYRARPELCVAIGLTLVVTWRLLLATRPDVDPPVPGPADPAPETGGFAELYTLEHRLSWGSVDAERFELRVRPQLVRLADERLRQRHGVERWRQPDLARGILGEPLWQLMTGPPTVRPPTPVEVADLITQLERI